MYPNASSPQNYKKEKKFYWLVIIQFKMYINQETTTGSMYLKLNLHNQKNSLTLCLNKELFSADPSPETINWTAGEIKKYLAPCQ